MITFNNKALPEWVSVTGIDFQSLNLSILEYETRRRVGNIDAGVERGGTNINLTLFIEPVNGLTLHDQSDELKAFLMGDNWEVSELIFSEQPNKFYKARVSDMEQIADNFTHGETTVSFYCADPKKYDVLETNVSSTNGEAVVNYTGLEKAPLLIEATITNNVTNIEFEHVESKRKIIVLGDFTVGQLVTIDSDNRNVLINGTRAKDKMAFESKWLYLKAGSNTFRCSSPDLMENDFEITYRKAD